MIEDLGSLHYKELEEEAAAALELALNNKGIAEEIENDDIDVSSDEEINFMMTNEVSLWNLKGEKFMIENTR